MIGSPPRILIVENDEAVAALFVAALTDEGYDVQAVALPETAVDLLARGERSAFRIVLSNPFFDRRRDRYFWLDQIVRHTDAAVVICSGYPAAMFSDHRSRGFEAFLQEPFNLQDLVNLVAALANGRGE